MSRATVSVWLIENNGRQFIVAVLTSTGCTDAGDRILMRTFHHLIRATDVYCRSQTVHKSIDGGYHRAVINRETLKL